MIKFIITAINLNQLIFFRLVQSFVKLHFSKFELDLLEFYLKKLIILNYLYIFNLKFFFNEKYSC